MAAHDASIYTAVAAGEVAESAARLPARKSVLKIPAPHILAEIAADGAKVTDLRRGNDMSGLRQGVVMGTDID